MTRTNILRFPTMGEVQPRLSSLAAPTPAVDTFDAERARSLLSIFSNTTRKAEILVGFVRSDRAQASAAGIEGIGLEIMTILESERFVRLKDALEEAVRSGEQVALSHEGLGKLHRLEALVSEGEHQLARAGGSDMKSLGGRHLSQAGPSSGKDFVVIGALVVLGAVAITLAVLLTAKGRSESIASILGSTKPHPRLKRRTTDERYS
jgi:hypothetical protein